MDPENFTSPRCNCAGAGAEDPELVPDPVGTSSAAPPLSSGKPPTEPGALNPDACSKYKQVKEKVNENESLKRKI
jgi:hypothetical protein